MHLNVYTSQEWQAYSESAHLICFNQTGREKLERCDLALMVVDGDVPLMYATIKEHDALSAHLSFGGAFPSCRGTTKSVKAYDLIMEYLKKNYEYVTMFVKNTNTPMLKFGLRAGFIITGIDFKHNDTYLIHYLEVKNVVGIAISNDSIRNDEAESSGERSA
jgi:hypothetical protein